MHINTEQRTPEWHAKRVGRVTGSVAGAILGLSPWQTADDVLRSMVRAYHWLPSEFVTNPAVEHGNNNERRAMLAFMRETGLEVADCGFFPLGYLGASPDGLTGDGGVLELKVPFGLRNGGEFKPLSEQPHYALQVQLEILCSGATHGWFAQYRAPKGDPFAPDYVPETIKIERVELGVIPFAELRAFHERYLSELDNPVHLEPLRVIIDTDEALHITNRIGELDDALHNHTEERKALLQKLVDMADGKNALVHGRNLTRTKDSESISYAKAIKAFLPDADLKPFTSVKSGFWKLS